MERLCIGFAMALLIQMPALERLAIANYQAAISSGKTESAFNLLKALGETLPKVLESLPESEFRQLQRDLPGAIVNREEIIFVEPDVNYFVDFAVSHGDAADRRFFAILKMVYPESVWPAYIEPQTDYSGCTAFGSGKLVEAYRLWSEFQAAFPDRYKTAVQNELGRAGHELTQSTCACGDSSAIQRELQEFVQAFPASPNRGAVENRLKRLKTGTSDIRARCISG